MDLITLTINGEPYVAVPRSEYERLTGTKPEERDDVDWARAELGRTLKRARETAGLSQGELAKKLKRSQTLISRAESGDLKVSPRYVADVLHACGLPETWPASANDNDRSTLKAKTHQVERRARAVKTARGAAR